MNEPDAPELLLSPLALSALIRAGGCIVVDCRFELASPGAGLTAFREGHIAGARYADLDRDLSSAITPWSGRHPLPTTAAFEEFLARIGWQPHLRLVAYDQRSNSMAARLWWLMRYHGLPAALLDGGLDAWIAGGWPLESGEQQVQPAPRTALAPDSRMIIDTGQLEHPEIRSGLTLVDARATERFSGSQEPLDSVAGHVPGARNRPASSNLDASGRFKPPDVLRREFSSLLGEEDLRQVVHYCGSGVTACHNQFAMEYAGLRGSRVYPGSWSEWIRDPRRPVATGA